MADIFTKLGIYIASPSNNDGTPRKPVPQDFQVWMTEVERLIKGLVAGAGGVDLPDLIYKYTITGGTSNNIVAVPNATPPSAPGEALFTIQTFQPNTGAVKINGKPLLTSSGNQITPGGLVPGLWLFLDEGSNFRLVSDQASQAIMDAAENAAAAAEEAKNIAVNAASNTVAQGNVPIYSTLSDLATLEVPVGLNSIWVNGRNTVGDGLGGLYVDVDNGSTDTIVSGGATSRTWYRVKDISTSKRVVFSTIEDTPQLVQKNLMSFDYGAIGTPLYPGAHNAPQGIAHIKFGGVDYAFVTQRCAGSNYQANERCRITQFVLKRDGSLGVAIAFSEEINIGHGAGCGAIERNGEIYLVTFAPTEVGHTGDDCGKGVSVIRWRGAATSQSDVTYKQLFGYKDSSHVLRDFYQAQVTVSLGGKYIVMSALQLSYGNTASRDHRVFVYDLDEVFSASAPLNVKPASSFGTYQTGQHNSQIIQGVAASNSSIAVIRGYAGALSPHTIQIYNYEGTIIREVSFSDQRSVYGWDGITENPSEAPVAIEPEGLVYLSENEIAFLISDAWNSVGDVVTFEGQNYICISSGSVNNAPGYGVDQWLPTNRASSGQYSSSATYSRGSTITRRDKVLWSIKTIEGEAGEIPLMDGLPKGALGSNAEGLTPVGGANLTFEYGSYFTVAAYAAITNSYYKALEYLGSGIRVFELGGDVNKYAQMDCASSADRGYVSFGYGALGRGMIRIYSSDDPVSTATVRITNGHGQGWRIYGATTNPTFAPDAAGANLGSTTARIGNIYLQNAPDVVSDERVKTPITPLTSAERLVAKDLLRKIGTYNLLSGSKKIVGVGAQTVISTFDEYGLNALDYNLINYAEWGETPEEIDQETGDVEVPYMTAGDTYSIRYEELAMFLIAALFSEV